MFRHQNKNCWLTRSFIFIASVALVSCSNASLKSSPIGTSQLITESCPKKLDGQVPSPSLDNKGGTVVVDIQVNNLGKASVVTIIQSSNNPQIDSAVISFYERCDYTIPKINGRIVTGKTTQGYTFYL